MSGPTWAHLGYSGPIWGVDLGLPGSIWAVVNQLDPIRIHLCLPGPLWAIVG